MSVRGAILDASIQLCRTALGDLPSGDLGAERGLRPGETLDTQEYPHMFFFNASDATEVLQWGQQRKTISYLAELWVIDETQEQLELRLDAIRTAVDADPTLGGLVDIIDVVGATLSERRETTRKSLLMEWTGGLLFAPVISYVVDVEVGFKDATTLASALTTYATLVEGVLGVNTRMNSDYRRLEGMPKGATRYQLEGISLGKDLEQDSNVAERRLPMVLKVHRRLADGEAERNYTEGDMLTQSAQFLDQQFWIISDETVIKEVPNIDFPDDVTIGEEF